MEKASRKASLVFGCEVKAPQKSRFPDAAMAVGALER